jgi:transketolase N-terminal domain/subunit/transketolase C-terminal domain/subunit
MTSSNHSNPLARLTREQADRNAALLRNTPTLGREVRSDVLPFALDLTRAGVGPEANTTLAALEKTAATIAIESLVSLGRVNDIDHLGGGLELIGPLLMTLSVVDYGAKHYAIEHGHTSIGYYAALAALGFLPRERVIESFRRSLDIAGHVSWVAGGTPIGSGRLGVSMPVGAGLALGLRAHHGADAFVVCHCGDAGWISGQALNGFTAASLHGAPISFVMHKNGIQLSGTTERIMNKDPRPIVSSLGITVLEIPSLHDRVRLFEAYREAYQLAQAARPSLIYPVGFGPGEGSTVQRFGEMYGIADQVTRFAEDHQVAISTPIWIPGSIMSFRDAEAMTQCVFYVNGLNGGEAHHDGGMKGRDEARVLGNPMLALSPEEQKALQGLRARPARQVVSSARPPRGTTNLPLDASDLAGIKLPTADKWVSARAGTEAAYVAVATKYPHNCFFVSCDLNPSTKLGKAADLLPAGHSFEMSIQEQAATLLTNGLAFSSMKPQLNVFATFAAFMEGIAREGFEFWRYQRNLDGPNEGLNVLLHLSHVGACTGRDHFSGWSLDWVNLALGYLPYLRRFYAPADARAAFLAVKDAAAGMGGHILAIPRDVLPVLTKKGTTEPIWSAEDAWEPVTALRTEAGAKAVVLALGAPAYVAAAAADRATAAGVPADVYVINGFPVPDSFFDGIAGKYRHVVTIEDGLIGTASAGLRGFAAFVTGRLAASAIKIDHFGIVDPQIAPSEAHLQVWEHYGMTEERVAEALLEQP